MKVCNNCIQPDTRPGIYFNDEGICGACLWEEKKKTINWKEREDKLMKIAKWAKQTTKSNYDCVIGVSGGKDSTKQALTARDKMGLRALLVNGEPDQITDIGKHNIENLKQLGFDVISLRPDPIIMRKLVKYDFYKYLNMGRCLEYALWSSAYIVADKFDIPLIIQGENQGLLLGVSLSGLGTNDNAFNVVKSNTFKDDWHNYLEVEGVTEEDLYLYHFNRKLLEEKGLRAIWLQYYLKEWSFRGNAEFSSQNGFKMRPDNTNPEDIGTHMMFAQLDLDLVQVNQLLKYVKLGFGQCMDHACFDIREGRINREEAISLVKKYDGKCHERYIKQFCNYIDITIEEFWRVTNSFRGTMWSKDKEGKWYNSYWDKI